MTEINSVKPTRTKLAFTAAAAKLLYPLSWSWQPQITIITEPLQPTGLMLGRGVEERPGHIQSQQQGLDCILSSYWAVPVDAESLNPDLAEKRTSVINRIWLFDEQMDRSLRPIGIG